MSISPIIIGVLVFLQLSGSGLSLGHTFHCRSETAAFTTRPWPADGRTTCGEKKGPFVKTNQQINHEIWTPLQQVINRVSAANSQEISIYFNKYLFGQNKYFLAYFWEENKYILA